MRSFKRITFYLMFFLYLPFTGYSYVSIQGSSQVIDKDIRAAVIALLFMLVVALAMLSVKLYRVPNSVVCAASFFIYGLFISFIRNSPDEYVSYALRTVSLILVFWIAYVWAKRNEQDWWAFARTVVLGSSSIYILESLIDLATGRAIAMNGALRLPGSIGSPAGYASVCMLFLLANIYFFLSTRSKTHFALSSLLVVCAFLTGTRAIAIAGLFALSCTVITYHRSPYLRILVFLISLIAAPLVIGWVMSSTEIGSRVALSLSDQGADTSTTFRMMILSTYFSRITGGQLLFGLGLGGFPKWFEAQTGIQDVGPHFEFLWVLSELGVVGLVLYIAVIGIGIRTIFFRWKGTGRLQKVGALSLILSQQLIFQFTNPLYFYQLCIPALFLLGGMLGANQRKLGN